MRQINSWLRHPVHQHSRLFARADVERLLPPDLSIVECGRSNIVPRNPTSALPTWLRDSPSFFARLNLLDDGLTPLLPVFAENWFFVLRKRSPEPEHGSHSLIPSSVGDCPGNLAAVRFFAMDYSQLITIEPGKRSGQPCIRGMRITVQDVLEYLAGGMTPDEVLADFPDLTAEDIRACLAFAADRERRLRVVPAA